MRSELDDNRRNWDDRVDIHFASAEYDVDGFVCGGSSLPRVDLDALGHFCPVRADVGAHVTGGDDRRRLPAPCCDRLPLCFSLRARAP